MNRNSNSHFAVNPTNLDIQRSTFDRSSSLKTTFNAGKLIPIFLDEVLPGDTFEMKTATIIRGSTPIFPVMDNANVDIYYFFVPNRLVWEHWKEFNGENTTSKWEQTIEYSIPQIQVPAGGWAKGTLADYFGLPTMVGGGSNNAWTVSHLPFRAYCLIWNEWFRDQNLQDPVTIDTGDANVQGVNSVSADNITLQNQNALQGGKPLPVNKYFDYFTGALPGPQKGPAVLLPIGNAAPVRTNNGILTGSAAPITWRQITGSGTTNTLPSGVYGIEIGGARTSAGEASTTVYKKEPEGETIGIYPSNLYADLRSATAATVNELRLAFQLQKLYERDARGGTRYIEILKTHFGVTSPDARLQRPEYLGGERIPINIDQVIQTSETQQTPQGNVAAYSLTGNQGSYFKHSFVEHGYILGLACIRTEHSYQQGIEKMWSRKNRFDFYWPALANIGEQAILNKEIFIGPNTPIVQMEEAFGYQEAWAEYRYKPNKICGAFRSNVQGSLDSWHYGDYYESMPMLSDEWIRETDTNVNRTLAVQSELEDQYIADFYFKLKCTRPMPVYSIPGLIDHH